MEAAFTARPGILVVIAHRLASARAQRRACSTATGTWRVARATWSADDRRDPFRVLTPFLTATPHHLGGRTKRLSGFMRGAVPLS